MGHIPVNLLLGAQQTLQQTGLIPVINTMAKTSSSNPAMAETVTARRSTRNKTAEQGGGGMVAVPPGSTTTTCTERQRVD